MKILLDANISWKLVNMLTPVFGGLLEILYLFSQIGHKIWKYAIKKKFQGSCGRNIVFFTG